MRLATLPVLALLGACGTPSTATDSAAHTLVLLKTGPKPPATKEDSNRIFAGHFANMTRLAHEGSLLVAGPYGRERHDNALRGIFVLRTGDREAARRLAETDPGFQAGVFVMEYHELVTDAPLHEFLVGELLKDERAREDGPPRQPGDGIRGYVLLTCSDGDRAERMLRHDPAVLLFGRLDGTRAFLIVDAASPSTVPESIRRACADLGECTLDAWFASGGLAHLRH